MNMKFEYYLLSLLSILLIGIGAGMENLAVGLLGFVLWILSMKLELISREKRGKR